MLIYLEVFIPANRLQDVAMGNEAVTNECALGNVTNASIIATRNVKHAPDELSSSEFHLDSGDGAAC